MKICLKTIKVNEITFKRNENIKGKSFNIIPVFSRSFYIINEKQYAVKVSVKILNSETQPFPFDVACTAVGYFEIEEGIINNNEDLLKNNGTQLLFPYLRSLLSSITATAMVAPINIPIIDIINTFINEESKKIEE